ncbi:cytochrome-c oxidase [Paenibacillus sediminis]|uniref:Cbb3-type cytochrome oxidase subunit 1 n=1 Tax=Paenibacillus sediminis TaxID=664909 RepID=A0ABS4GYZ8_9BACL|nr:cytochrome-c oxidase [Paenibacillus sediminis]MBP1935491.1 cbb3-type cytochrome oxidase subunit 1 [Paenibacillus sediminis]
MGIRLIKISVVYFVIGVLLGMYMSMSHSYTYTGVHVHINLLGWVSLAVSGLIYHLFPKAGESTLGKIHFWLHNIGVPIMMIGLFLLLSEVSGMEPVIAVGGVITVLGVIFLALNVFQNVRPAIKK